uniref:Serine/threonine-protein kinase PAK 2 n=2 Tax=Lygus hesperus TaxID=30085 RepID=A0A0A9Y7U3_LYGHE
MDKEKGKKRKMTDEEILEEFRMIPSSDIEADEEEVLNSEDDNEEDNIEFPDWNATKGTVDTFERICQNMNANRKTQRWPMCIFYNMINIAVHNSYDLYLHNFYKKSSNEKTLSRFDYVMSLAHETHPCS